MKSRWAETLPAQGMQFLFGAAVTLLSTQLATVWAAICGVSAESTGIGCLACAGTLLLAGRLTANCHYSMNRLSTWACAIGLSVGVAAAPFLLNQTLSWGISTFDGAPWLSFAAPAILNAVLVGVLWIWADSVASQSRQSIRLPFITLLGACCGLLLAILHGVFVFPTFIPIAVAVLAATGLWHVCGQRCPTSQNAASTIDNVKSSGFWWQIFSTLGLGLFLHSAVRLTSVLMPISFALLLPSIAMLGVMYWTASLPRIARWLRRPAVAGILLLLPVLVPVAFGNLVEWNLQLNATVSSVTLILLVRSLQLATLCGIGILIRTVTVSADENSRLFSAHQIPFVFLGLVASVMLASSGLQPATCMALSIIVMLGAMVSRNLFPSASDTQVPQQTFFQQLRTPALATGCLAAIVSVFAPLNVPAATQLLFNARAAQGLRHGLSSEVILQSNSVRLLEEQQGKTGHLTCWRTSGDQIQIRRDGIPVGQVSANIQTTPQPVSETLPVVLPLVMHRNASSILLLGDELGVGATVCNEFPVHTIVATSTDPVLTELTEKYAWKHRSMSVMDSNRLTVRHEPAAVAIRRPVPSTGRFDVVVAMSPNPATLGCLEQLTPEFYAAVRSQLTNEGVFCQRITRHDIGAVPLFRIISAVSETFERVVMLHMAPGEIALVAGVTPDSILDDKLLTRLQRQHVKRILGQSGWDWSQVAAIPAVDTSDPVGIFEHQQQLAAASVANSHFAFSLPLEAASWTDKAAELRSTFAPHQQRMADAAERGDGYDEFARSFSAVVQQMEILTTYPDQPWPYRRSLKMEMQRNARPPVESLQNGNTVKTADPRDEHRKNYFETLGQVLQQTKDGSVDPMSLRQLTQFTKTYVPLLSHFAHHELTRIHELGGHPGPALELRHRLHSVYFTAGGDFSVRQVANAMQQILDDPELIEDDAVRYDHVNSMLQELVRRWEVRRDYEPPSARRAQRTVDVCVNVAKKSLDAMQEWSPAVGVPNSSMMARRKFINKALISPLRTYGEQVLAHRMKSEAPIRVAEDDAGNDLPLLMAPGDALTN